jgi:FkbM family methyltransferase
MESSSYTTIYKAYLQDRGFASAESADVDIATAHHWFEQTNWDDPQTPLDCNNNAVIALIEAEQTDDRALRSMYLETAIALLSPVAADHPLCAAHLAVVHSLLGDPQSSTELAFPTFLTALNLTNDPTAPLSPGMVYLPRAWQHPGHLLGWHLSVFLKPENASQQAVLLLGAILCQAQFIFYNSTGLRFLHLAAQLFPDSAWINLKLGISSLLNAQWEGLLYLHRAQTLQPQNSTILQALYLAYSDLQQPAIAAEWRAKASSIQKQANAQPWDSIEQGDRPFTYLPIASMLLAAEPSFRSIVTSVLLAEGQWFEREMEFWHDHIQTGMTVLDVGANVGVYTWAAAERVGATGRVLAVEPFTGCVQCLQETRRVNHMDWVTICHGAASDRDGTVRLALHGASELNEVISAESEIELDSTQFETVPCFTLDTLITQKQLHQVDLLKIDAEGHEIQVLKGCDRLLREFAPVILYENIAKGQQDNFPVAEFLLNQGYQLFRYQPYIKQLLPIATTADLQGSLNIIALPAR